MADWEDSDKEEHGGVTRAPPAPKVAAVKKASKWADEDEEEEVASDWEESSSEEEEDKPSPPPPPPKKKGSIKAKIAEKEALKAAKKDGNDGVEYDSDEVLDPREKANKDKEREMREDLNNAAELFGAAALGGTSSSELDWLISTQPRTREDFQQLSNKVIEYIIKRHQDKPLYPSFVEHHARALAMPLKDVEVRKAASVLTTLANEKQKEQRDKASGKKPKVVSKPGLGSVKGGSKFDTRVYDEALDDFGNDDFM